MKKYLLLPVFGLSLVACQKEKEVVPAVVSGVFDQKFTLRYQQQATLPASTKPELVLTLTDFHYAICREDVLCIAADYVSPKLSVRDAQGRTQQLEVGATYANHHYPAWIDTASIRANGQRYLLYYQQYQVDSNRNHRKYPEKKHLAVELRVVKL